MKSSYFYYGNILIKSILVIGLGSSGYSVVNFLKSYRVNISGFDEYQVLDNIQCFTSWKKIKLEKYDLLVVSPGIPINQKPFNTLYSYWNKVIGDIDLFINNFSKRNYSSIVAVTGSNGKSTVSTLLHNILNQAGIKSALVGNIGTPILSVISEEIKIYILEISSFQINLLKSAYFEVGCVLNISVDHLDRYPNFDAYRDTKLSLLSLSKYKIMNYRDYLKYNIILKSSASTETSFFNNDKNHINYDAIVFNKKVVLREADLKLKGRHNLENILAVLCILKALNLNYQEFLPYLKKSEGLLYCCQKFNRVINGIEFINDSKSTNISAVIAAIESINRVKNIILLFGGLSKKTHFNKLLPILLSQVSFICIYGKDRYIFEKILKYTMAKNYTIVNNLSLAFHQAMKIAKSGDVVLLSPGCSSLDEFSGYKARGEYFIKCINSL